MAISEDPAVALEDIQSLIAVQAPRVRCEMVDGDTRLRCHGVMSDGTEVNAEIEWRGLSEADFSMLGKELAAAYRKAGEEP